MKLFRYTEYITESKLELLLEANMIFSKDFLATLFNLKNPIAEKILKLYKTDVDVDTNYIDLSDKENFVSFKSDKKSKNSCVIVNIGASYTDLSKRLFPSFAKLHEQPNIKNGYISWWELLPRNQKATIIDEIKTDSTLTKKRLGLNRLYASDLRVYLDSGEVRSITYFDKPDGIFYPMNQIKEEEKFIVGFEWLVAKRPKNPYKMVEMD
jgi:hypothetical protein